MKKRPAIFRIFLYTALICSFIAAWVAVNVLDVKEPPQPESSMTSFSETTSDLTGEIIEKRKADLDSLSNLGDRVGINGTASYITSTGAGNPAETMLADTAWMSESENGIGGRSLSDRILTPSPELAGSLDSADALYQESIDEQTAVQVPYLTQSMLEVRNSHMELLGFRKIDEKIVEKIVQYHKLNSLDIMQLKRDWYASMINSLISELKAARDAREAEAASLGNDVKAEYDAKLDSLLNDISDLVINQEFTTELPRAVVSLEKIRLIIADLENSRFYNSGRTEHVEIPVINHLEWIENELEQTATVEIALADENSE